MMTNAFCFCGREVNAKQFNMQIDKFSLTTVN